MGRRPSEDRGTFVPVFDGLVRLVGPTAAIVYGVVWRYEQMDSGRCSAAVKTIAERAGVAERSAFTALRLLVRLGLVFDETPGRRNAPHVLRTVDFSRRTAEEECPEGIEEPIGPDGLQELQPDKKSASSDDLQELQPGKQILQSEDCKICGVGSAILAGDLENINRLPDDIVEEKAPLPGDLVPVVTSLAARAERARASHNAFFRQ